MEYFKVKLYIVYKQEGGFILNIRELREDKGLTQECIASMLNITQGSYCKKEKGYRKFKVDELIKLKDILGVELEEVIKASLNN